MNLIKQIALLLIFTAGISFSQISTIWSKYYNKNIRDEAYFVCPTFDNGCIISGVVDGYDRTCDIFILKLDSNGDILWSRTIGEKETQERGLCVRQTKDSCYIVTGYIEISSYKIYLLKLNSSGGTLWSRTYGKGVGGSVIQTHDQCYLIAADKDTLSGRYTNLIKTDSDGNVLWSKIYDINSPITYSVMEMSNGDFNIGCDGFSSSENKFVEMYCTDSLGNMKWLRLNEKHVSIKSTLELSGNFIMGVGSVEDSQEVKLRIIKTDTLGKTVFEREYGMGNYTGSSGTGIELFGSNKFIIAAQSSGYGDVITNQWAWLLAIDLYGDTLWTRIVNNTNSNTQSGQLNSIGKLSNDQYYVAGWFRKPPDYDWDFWITKFELDTTISGIDLANGSKVFKQFILKQNYPNPFNPTTKIEFAIPTDNNVEIKVFNVLGMEVATLINGHRQAGTHSIEFNASKLSSGVYFYKVVSGNFSEIKKMILLR